MYIYFDIDRKDEFMVTKACMKDGEDIDEDGVLDAFVKTDRDDILNTDYHNFHSVRCC